MAQDQKDNGTGFAIPAPQSASTSSVASSDASATTTTTHTEVVAQANIGTDTSSRDLMIGGAILLILIVAFFFGKNAYANMLVTKRVPPNKANAAGWWLFIFLTSLATAVVLPAVNPARFLSPLVLAPLGIVAIASLVLAIVSGRK
ncbi:hypothetical protein [Burkholderia sp. 22PA0106]|uniref:hypothetical protein n=1 Tax=Burkholderia sp. 22PA0106 TaxID=3237371 RepID=UPI0039C29206